MKREVIITADGSSTIHLPDWNEHYHSKHGAIQESYHVFIKMGFFYYLKKYQPASLNILEIGFGTGLNAFITLLESNNVNTKIEYNGIEAYPITNSELEQLNYTLKLKASKDYFKKIHSIDWELTSKITNNFKLVKRKQFFKDIKDKNTYQLIYFDAFGARVQPELWTEEIFTTMFQALTNHGILVTYSAKGSVRRALQTVGFTVERLPGPPGKREMLRATKLNKS